ncbi:PREDICTED: pentatricopeptide repeat-containing protein At3g22690 [Ipomoea nil]|uniref:pentatricopeptide repeat-containing protein At3g22690 n=1 Tax=Ipomoea nil TaxID=35883 RepID=UPI000901A5B9|nr:PREDICTED: pentatricopeptide repeat-containing protein At3g22690 [Ipomoea nil]
MAIATISSPLSIPLSNATHLLSPQNQPAPSARRCNSRIGSLKSCKNFNEIKQFHAHMTKRGLSDNPTELTRLISKYSEVGTIESLEYARIAFKILNNVESNSINAYIFNSLIKGYSSSGLIDEAILVFVEMVSQGVGADSYTFPFVLGTCVKGERFSEGNQVHGLAVKMGLGDNMFVSNSLVHFYGECGEVDNGRKVFDKMCERNVVSWTSLIDGYVRINQPKEAVTLFFEMIEDGIMPNLVTMACVISACAKLGDLDLGERVCTFIGESGLKVNNIVVNALVDMYMKCGASDRAKQLFEGYGDRNLVLYNTVLTNYVHNGFAKEALDVLNEMLHQGPRPDRVTLLATFATSAQVGDVFLGKQCHGYALRNGLEIWDSVGNAIIDMYMKCGKEELGCRVFNHMSNKTVVSWNSLIAGFVRNGDVGKAQEIFNQMTEKNLVSWNTIIGGLVQESLFEDAIHLFRIMLNEGIKANEMTMVSVACACGYLGALDLAKWIYSYVEKTEINCDIQLSTALLDMFARCGDISSAMEVFNKMKVRDVSAWSAAIGATAKEGNGKRAVELFYEMLQEDVKPDEVVFVAVLTACSHGGLVEEGKNIFRSMEEIHGISPQIVHYGCLVDLLGRAGLLDEALNVINNMPIEPNSAVWGALLAACRKHKNDEMATRAAEMIGEPASDENGIHVLLSNIYAHAGKWSDVAKVRLSMKEKGIRKCPGSSSIEVNGVIHEFTSADESHMEKTQINIMLEEMYSRLRGAGYVPDLTNVLLDIDDQEKEFSLSRHSEKMAMAFGLISTQQRCPIRIVNNLRMCSDCHSFAKFVSKVYNRDVVVRDNNRFHFFRQGLCSCGDYW